MFQSFYLPPRNPGLANNLRSLVNGQAGKAYSKLTGTGYIGYCQTILSVSVAKKFTTTVGWCAAMLGGGVSTIPWKTIVSSPRAGSLGLDLFLL